MQNKIKRAGIIAIALLFLFQMPLTVLAKTVVPENFFLEKDQQKMGETPIEDDDHIVGENTETEQKTGETEEPSAEDQINSGDFLPDDEESDSQEIEPPINPELGTENLNAKDTSIAGADIVDAVENNEEDEETNTFYALDAMDGTGTLGTTVTDIKLREVIIAATQNVGKPVTDETPINEVVEIFKNNNLGISAKNRGITSLEGLQYFTSLTTIQVDENQITSLAPIKGLGSLGTLSVANNKLGDEGIAHLKNGSFPGLKALFIGENSITDISFLKKSAFPSLEILDLGGGNKIKDISPLQELTTLKKLTMTGNRSLTDISALSTLTNLRALNLGTNSISSIEPLKELINLDTLNVSNNLYISDLSPLENMKQLKTFSADKNLIKEISSEVYAVLQKADTAEISSQNFELEAVTIIDNKVSIENMIKVAGNFVKVTPSDGGTLSDDNKTITWEFTGTPPDKATFKFSENIGAENATGSSFAGEVTIPLKKTFTVTFGSNGGAPTPSAINNIVSGSAIAAPAEPTRSGYNFAGWYTDTALENKYDFTTPVTTSFTLYAKWEAMKHTVTFNSNGGSAVEATQVLHEERLTEPAKPTRTGYDFAGWYTDTALENKYDFATPVTSSFTLYAKWEAIASYTVTFDSNGGSVVEATQVLHDELLTEPEKPTRTGYNFAGWYTDIALENKYDFTTPVTTSFTLYAKWTVGAGSSPTPTNTTGSVPKAGDETPLVEMVLLLFLSTLGICVLAFRMAKNKNSN
ncbi:MAG: hypothetical protein GX786_02685, partial [Clostridiales bacterium]|nr:hypothetical protein [Clostridiales bacterium]